MGDYISGSTACVEGSIVRTTRSVANIPVGSGYRGRIVNALGSAMDGMGAVKHSQRLTVNSSIYSVRLAVSWATLTDTVRELHSLGLEVQGY